MKIVGTHICSMCVCATGMSSASIRKRPFEGAFQSAFAHSCMCADRLHAVCFVNKRLRAGGLICVRSRASEFVYIRFSNVRFHQVTGDY